MQNQAFPSLRGSYLAKMSGACILALFCFALVASSTLAAPPFTFWTTKNSATVAMFPLDGNEAQPIKTMMTFGSANDFRREYLKGTRIGASVHTSPGQNIYVFGRLGNATSFPEAIVGVANPWDGSLHEMRLNVEPGHLVYGVMEAGTFALVITAKISFDAPLDKVLIHEISFAPNGTIAGYKRISAPFPPGANVSLIGGAPTAADDSFVYMRVSSGFNDRFDLILIAISRIDGTIVKAPLPSILDEYNPLEEWYAGPTKGSLVLLVTSVDLANNSLASSVSAWMWNVGENSQPQPIAHLTCPDSTPSFYIARKQGAIDRTTSPQTFHQLVTCTSNDPPTADAYLFTMPLVPASAPVPVQGRRVNSDLSATWGLTVAF